MHICVSKLSIIGSNNGLSPDQCQAIIWTNDGILLIGSLGTNFSEILIKIQTFFQENAFENVVCKMEAICLDLNMLKNSSAALLAQSLQLHHKATQWTFLCLISVLPCTINDLVHEWVEIRVTWFSSRPALRWFAFINYTTAPTADMPFGESLEWEELLSSFMHLFMKK